MSGPPRPHFKFISNQEIIKDNSITCRCLQKPFRNDSCNMLICSSPSPQSLPHPNILVLLTQMKINWIVNRIQKSRKLKKEKDILRKSREKNLYVI